MSTVISHIYFWSIKGDLTWASTEQKNTLWRKYFDILYCFVSRSQNVKIIQVSRYFRRSHSTILPKAESVICQTRLPKITSSLVLRTSKFTSSKVKISFIVNPRDQQSQGRNGTLRTVAALPFLKLSHDESPYSNTESRKKMPFPVVLSNCFYFQWLMKEEAVIPCLIQDWIFFQLCTVTRTKKEMFVWAVFNDCC